MSTLDNKNVVHGEGDGRCNSSCNEGDGLFEIVSEAGDSRETLCAWLRCVREPPNGQQVSLLLRVLETRRHMNRFRWQLLLYTPLIALMKDLVRQMASTLAIIACL